MGREPVTPVAIVGGGPVGMVLALFLDRYGVPSVIFNLGLAAASRRLGLPWDHAAGISLLTRYDGYELCRVDRPGPGAALRRVAAAERTDQVPEPMHRANQVFVEWLLLAHLRTRPRITVRFGTRVTDVTERADHVALATESAGTHEAWRAGCAVGCDGGHSVVRRAPGVRYAGEAGLEQDVPGRRATAAHLRIPALYAEALGPQRAWSYWAYNSELALNLIAVDGDREFFLLTSSLDPDTATPADFTRPVSRDLYACELALIRPDQYVAWRDDKAPADVDKLVKKTLSY